MSDHVVSNSSFDTKTLLKPFHVIRLGYLTHFESGSTLTVGDYAGGDKRGVKLKPEYVALINSLDVTVNDREFNAEELGLISWMVGQRFLAIIGFNASIKDFDIVPVPRSLIELEEKEEEGYIARMSNGVFFELSEIGARALSLIDGVHTLGEIVENIKQDILDGSSSSLLIAENEKEQGKTFDLILLEEMLDFIKVTTNAAVITYEPQK